MCLNLGVTGSDTNGGGSFLRGLYGSLQRKATAIAKDGVRMVSPPAAGKPAKHNGGLQRGFWIYIHAESSGLVSVCAAVLAGERSDLRVLAFSGRSPVGFPGRAALLVDLEVAHRVTENKRRSSLVLRRWQARKFFPAALAKEVGEK